VCVDNGTQKPGRRRPYAPVVRPSRGESAWRMMLASPANVDADIKDHHSDRSPRTRASYTSRRGPIAKPAKKQNSHREQRFPSPTPPAMAMAMGKKKTQMLRTFRSHLNLSLMDCARTYGPRGSEIGPRTADTPHTTRARARACGAVWEEGAPRCPRASRIPARLWDAPYTLQIAHNNERTMLRRGRKRVQRHSETQW
jgi:hypothetical protein